MKVRSFYGIDLANLDFVGEARVRFFLDQSDYRNIRLLRINKDHICLALKDTVVDLQEEEEIFKPVLNTDLLDRDKKTTFKWKCLLNDLLEEADLYADVDAGWYIGVG